MSVRILASLALFSLLGLANGQAAERRLSYVLRPKDLVHQQLEVRLEVTGIGSEEIAFRIGNESPGRYMAHDFARHVRYPILAEDGEGRSLDVTRTQGDLWLIGTKGEGRVKITYVLYGGSGGGTYNAIDTRRLLLNGPATFGWVDGFRDAPVTVRFEDLPRTFEIAVALPAEEGVFSARNHDHLVDSPFLIAPLRWASFELGGRTIRLAFHQAESAIRPDAFEELVSATRKVTTFFSEVFGGMPCDYVFLLEASEGTAGDGMEHRESTVITNSSNVVTKEDVHRELLGTISHEFFHLWNVERIRPSSIEPFDLVDAQWPRELWFSEGFTNYFGPYALVASGIEDVPWFCKQIERLLAYRFMHPGHRRFPVEESSLYTRYAYTRYGDDMDEENIFTSYYPYGALIALSLDLELRRRSGSEVSLSSVMRAMWERFGRDVERPITTEDIIAVTKETFARSGEAAWVDGFFRRCVQGVEPLPLEGLAEAGFEIVNPKAGSPSIGIYATSNGSNFTQSEGGLMLSACLEDSPAWRAGLAKGDVIVGIEGERTTSLERCRRILERHEIGDRVEVAFFRGTRLSSVSLELGEDFEVQVREVPSNTAPQRAFREDWLKR